VVVDYSHGSAAVVLPSLLGRLGVDEVTLNAPLEALYRAPQKGDIQAMEEQLATIVRSLGADLGVWVQPGAEHLLLADRSGRLWRGMDLLMLLGALMVRASSRHVHEVILPVFAPSSLVHLYTGAGWSVQQISSDPRMAMRSASAPGVVFASTGDGDLTYTDLHAAPDAMFGLAKILEHLAVTGLDLVEVAKDLPSTPYLTRALSCPMERKGTIMRRFAEMAQERDASFVDGVKVILDEGWVQLRADRTAPRLHLVVEADSIKQATAMLDRHEAMILEWVREGS
jgi:mannose-1-phosphate guanylyltransferase/phosphomannomutase